MSYGLKAGDEDYSSTIPPKKANDYYFVLGMAKRLSKLIHLPVSIIDHDEEDESVLTVSQA